ASKIVVLVGAGISTSAGIPDFRSPGTGLYDNLQALNLPYPEAVFDLGFFKKNPKPFWTLAKELYPGRHLPTPTHYFIRLLEEKGLLRRLFTQNIDTLETLSGLNSDRVIEAHGSFATARCLSCAKMASREYVLRKGVLHGEVVRCECGGLVKPDIVFFGEALPQAFWDNLDVFEDCDLLIVIGTSLQVSPFANLPDFVKPPIPRLLINREIVGQFSHLSQLSPKAPPHPLPLRELLGPDVDWDKGRDCFWQGDADEGVRRLVSLLGWEKELEDIISTGREELRRKWKEE
ncbi:hypothetical protein TREMEDRAFT_22252, partial [Tremella mesenterica DSM 1558]|uniref:uncharacterized protein n=1 Tax=Tremella mesenterica (strain ATCC 24925 / CBS 8224 / DSM 1558 / NBRC 9311 / NRRL Y-6157 / RJB 2259-6 / UBC 559-6) TaxID=578456 RepID=UPI0003F497C9